MSLRSRTVTLVAVLLTVGLAAAATGCGKDGKGSTGAAARVELHVLWWGGPQRAQLTNQALDLYTAKHPNITFKRDAQEWNGYFGRLESALGVGTDYDLFQLNDDVLRDYTARNIILDLGKYTSPGGLIPVDQISEGLLACCQVDGKPRAIPIAGNTQSVVYDRTVVKQYGLEEPALGWSYEQFFSWAVEVATRSGGQVAGSMDASGAQRAFWAWLRAAGKEFYNGGGLGFDSSDLRRWFEMWADARKRGALASADQVHLADSESIDKQLVVTKQAAVSFIWSNQMPEAQKLTDHELGITSYPGDPKGQWARASMEWAISSSSQHQDQAADVINFLVNDPEAGRILGTERGLPANLQIREQIAPTLTPAMKLSMEFERAMLPRFGPTPSAPPRGQSTLSKLLMAAAESVIYGQRTPQQAAEEFTVQAVQALAG